MASDSAPIRIPMIVQPENRAFDTSVDSKLVDCYAEKALEGDYWIQKRPGFTQFLTGTNGVGGGIYQWNTNLLTIEGSNAYNNGALIGAANAFGGTYWFNNTLGTPSYAYFSNGIQGFTYSSAGAYAPITDAAYPPATVPGSAYLDGTLYVMDSSARIWGSKFLNNPTVWDPLNVIVAQMTPDRGVAIAKQLLYVVAFKEFTTEFFYDAGASQGTVTGSPLLPVQNAKLGYGCGVALSVQDIDDTLFFVSTTRAGGLMVGTINQIRYSKISWPSIDRFLSTPAGSVIGSWFFRAQGHTFYVMTCFGGVNLVYDINEGLWYYWNNPTNVIASSGTALLAAPDTCIFQTSDGRQLVVTEGVVKGVDFLNSITYPIIADIITPNYDGGAKLKKVLTRLKFIADQNGAGMLLVRWSDDDFKTWSNWRQVNLNDPWANLPDCGTFYKRAFWLRHQVAAPFRIRAIEPELKMGSI